MGKMKSIVMLAIIWALLISGCGAQSQNVTEDDTDFEQAATLATAGFTFELPIADDLPMFTFEAYIVEGLPAFTFEVYENEVSDHGVFPYIYDVHISCPALLDDYIPQSIEISSSVKWKEEYREHYIDLVDIDFDGYSDMQAATSEGTVNVNYVYYRWNVFVGQGYGEFEDDPFFEMLTAGYELYRDTSQIISMSRDSAVNHPREMYQLGNTRNGGWLGEYKVIRREEQELIQGENGEDMIKIRVFFADEEIYTETLPSDGDGYDTSEIIDNYLRFGIDNPIDPETAIQLLYQEYGDADNKTGYSLMFTFEEMILHENLSCYKYRMQWLVDESHWSTIGFVIFTPDSKVFNEE